MSADPRKDQHVAMGEAEAVMRKMVEMFATGDVSGVDDVVSAEYHDHQGLNGVAIRGPHGFRQVVETARAGDGDLRVTIEDLIEGVDRAAARLRWLRVSAAGERTERETLDIVRIRDRKAVEHWARAALPKCNDSSADRRVATTQGVAARVGGRCRGRRRCRDG